MNFKISFIIITLLTIAGCSSSPIKIADHTTRTNIDFPNINEHITMGLGETLVAKGVRTTGEAIEIIGSTSFNKSEGESSIMTCAATVQPGVAFKRGIYNTETILADCFGPINYQLTLADGTINWNCPGRIGIGDICLDSSGNYFLAFLNHKVDLKKDFNNIIKTKKTIERKENFIQEFIYNGRVGDSLKFIYLEFSDNLARPAFTQEVQYDLSSSHTIGFRNLRIEILEASNTEITYILINNF